MFGTTYMGGMGNRDYQQGLAAALVASEGMDRAIEIGLTNGWQGVVEILVEQRFRTSAKTGPKGGST